MFIQYKDETNKKIDGLQEGVTEIKIEQAKQTTEIIGVRDDIRDIKEMLKK